MQEHVTGMSVVQIFRKEADEFKKFSEINADHREANIKSIFIMQYSFQVLSYLAQLQLH